MESTMAASGRFTDLFIDNLKPEGKVADHREQGSAGFGVRVLPNGTKKFFYVYNLDGKRRFLNLGIYKDTKHKGGITLAEARKRLVKAMGKVHDKIDPLLEKDTEKAERKRTPFLADFVDEYISRHAKEHNRSWKQIERALKTEIVPKWGKRKITDIKRRDLVLLLDDVKDRAPVMANRVLAYTRKMFSWAVSRDVIEVNPFMGMTKPSKEEGRSRVLSENEIKTLWNNLDKARISDPIKRALKIILVTGQRPGEVIGMHRMEINGDWWEIPAERSKNKQAHRVFLTQLAKKLIGEKDGFIFESPVPLVTDGKTIERAYEVRTLTNSIKENLPHTPNSKIEDRLKIPHFVPHDLRRTAATRWAEMGISGEMIDRLQNHITKQKQGVGHIYNRYSYDKEKQMALESWERKLNSITTGSQDNVICIKSGHKAS